MANSQKLNVLFCFLKKFSFFQVVACAQGMAGRNSFEDTQHSYAGLKDALRLCAAFRGTYLDFKVNFIQYLYHCLAQCFS